MKLNHLFPQRHKKRVVRQFGAAKLMRRTDGQHELIGGTDADRHEAFEWASLFAHEIVFTHFYREAGEPCGKRSFSHELQPAF